MDSPSRSPKVRRKGRYLLYSGSAKRRPPDNGSARALIPIYLDDVMLESAGHTLQQALLRAQVENEQQPAEPDDDHRFFFVVIGPKPAKGGAA